MKKKTQNTDYEPMSVAGDAKAIADNLAEQLRMAGLVQRDFLPSQLPNNDHLQWAACFFPAEWVSGDIYDVVRLDEQHIGFYIADVVGHGVPAALLTIFLKQALQMRQTVGNRYEIFSPAEVMATLNLKMTSQKFSGNQFATCCYCLLNTESLELTYCRAGHPYPILIRKGEKLEQLQLQGSLLGIFEEIRFHQQTVQLQRGDKILLYSDGAEEIIGNFDELTGFTFSSQFLDIKDLPIEKMVDELSVLVRSRRPKPFEIDDVTAVALEIL